MSQIRKIAKINIEGYIDYRLETQVLRLLTKINRFRIFPFDCISLTINSYGGSLIAAKNISESFKAFREKKNIPIFCFAEDFCLNSANLILSIGNRSYANKFTVMGDYGYVYEDVEESQFNKKYGIGIQKLTNNDKNKEVSYGFFDNVRINNPNKISQYLNTSADDLIKQIIENRKRSIEALNDTPQDIGAKLTAEGVFHPQQALQSGIIDELTTFQEIQDRQFPKAKLKLLNDRFPYPLIHALEESVNFLRAKV